MTFRHAHYNQDASQDLGIALRSFARLCQQHGIETPYARKQRWRSAAGSICVRPQ